MRGYTVKLVCKANLRYFISFMQASHILLGFGSKLFASPPYMKILQISNSPGTRGQQAPLNAFVLDPEGPLPQNRYPTPQAVKYNNILCVLSYRYNDPVCVPISQAGRRSVRLPLSGLHLDTRVLASRALCSTGSRYLAGPLHSEVTVFSAIVTTEKREDGRRIAFQTQFCEFIKRIYQHPDITLKRKFRMYLCQRKRCFSRPIVGNIREVELHSGRGALGGGGGGR